MRVHLCVLTEHGAVERALTPQGAPLSESPPISEAAWLRPEREGGAVRKKKSWFARLLSLWTPAPVGDPLRPPFDASGGDALGLFAPGSPFLPNDRAMGRWRGALQCADGPALLDWWGPDWRLTLLRDLLVQGPKSRERARVRLQKAPLVLAPPTESSAEEALALVPEAARAKLLGFAGRALTGRAAHVALRDGDAVEVLGIARPSAWEAAPADPGAVFRSVAGASVVQLADEHDVRVVVRCTRDKR